MAKKGERYIDEIPMSESTKALTLKNGILVRRPQNIKKYSKWERRKVVYKGYSCLENLYIVRMYIMKTHGVSFSLLETLLYIAPKGYFTYVDYKELSKQFDILTVKRLVSLGYAKRASNSGKSTKALYALTRKATNVVIEFYELLLGDKPFDVKKAEKYFSPDIKTDTKTLSLIKKLDKNI